MKRTNEEEIAAGGVTTAPVRRKRILIVEDDLEQRDMLQHHLEHAGYTVMTTISSQGALVYSELSEPDLILLDIMLSSDMDGLEVLLRLRHNLKTVTTPVIIVSALSDDTRMHWAREVGAVDYVIKPYDITDLLSRVQHALSVQAERAPD